MEKPQRSYNMKEIKAYHCDYCNKYSSSKSTMSSREIAELTGKHHKNVLVDCEKLNENYRDMGLAEISADLYRDTYGRGRYTSLINS